MKLKKLLTVTDLANATGYSRVQIHNQINRGNIKTAFRSELLILISRAEFDRVVNDAIKNGKYKTFRRIRNKAKRISITKTAES